MYFERINQGKEYFGPKYDIELVERFTNDSHVVADLFILQKCKYFIGSHESSFSIMIKYIRDNNLDYQIKGIL